MIITATITPEMVFLRRHVSCRICSERKRHGRSIFRRHAADSFTEFQHRTEFLINGKYDNVLVIGAETLSKITDYKDRKSCILFGDGAGAL